MWVIWVGWSSGCPWSSAARPHEHHHPASPCAGVWDPLLLIPTAGHAPRYQLLHLVLVHSSPVCPGLMYTDPQGVAVVGGPALATAHSLEGPQSRQGGATRFRGSWRSWVWHQQFVGSEVEGRRVPVSLCLLGSAFLPAMLMMGDGLAQGTSQVVIPLLCLAGTQSERSQGLQGQPHISHYGRYLGGRAGWQSPSFVWLCGLWCLVCVSVYTLMCERV